MSFTWPAALLLGLAVPLVLGTYLLAARRRRRHAVSYSSLALLRKALPRRSRWRRHIPVAMLLTSLAVLAVAAARPQLTSDVPVSKTTIILALDESGSMCLTDVLPNRLTVAQHAAREFVDAQPKGTQMGLVLFAGYAELAVPPTTDRKRAGPSSQQPQYQPGDRDRRGDPEVARRHRRGGPRGPAGRQRRVERRARPVDRRCGARQPGRRPRTLGQALPQSLPRTATCPT